MTQFALSARDRRTAVAGMIVVGSLITLSRGMPALANWERVRISEASDAVARAASARAMVKLLPALRDSLRSRATQLSVLDSLMFRSAVPDAAAADLAAAVDDIAATARLRVTAMQLRADSSSSASVARVAVRVTATGDVAGLARFLREVEADDAPLVVRELSVSQPEPAAPDGRPESLHIDVVVEGLGRIAARRPTRT